MSSTRFRPADLEKASDGGSKFLGFVNMGIVDWEDRSDRFDWADVYLVATLAIEDSKYPQEMKLVGSYDREPNGNIKTCTLLKRVYWLFDTIGFEGGPNVQGEMVNDNGDSLDIIQHLNQNHITNPLQPSMEYIAYVYKEQGRKDPSKTYTTVFPKIAPNTPAGRKDLQGYIDFMKSKNLIKEVTGNTGSSAGILSPSNGAIGEPTGF